MLFLNLKGHRCAAYDRRGHGRSSVPAGGYDYDNLADDLHAVLEALDVRDAVLVGHSMASGELVRYLTRHGGASVRKLVFVSPYATPSSLKTADNADGVTREELDYFLNHVILADYQRWIEENKAPFFVEDTPATSRDWIIQMMLKTSLKATYECTRRWARRISGPRWRASSCRRWSSMATRTHPRRSNAAGGRRLRSRTASCGSTRARRTGYS